MSNKIKPLINRPSIYQEDDSPTCSCDEDLEFQQQSPTMIPLLDVQDQVSLESEGIIILNSEINEQTLTRIYRRLLVLHFDREFIDPIQLIINSPGGYCSSGWALIDLMRFIDNPIRTIAIGEIASMATSIFIAGDERIMSPNSLMMIHQFSAGGEGTYTDLVANQISYELEMQKHIRLLIECSKYKTEAQVLKNLLKPHDVWLTPEEALKHGLCDSISTPRKKGQNRKKK